MIKQIALLFCLCSSILSIAQTDKIINVDETNRILSFLASDAMKGRRTNTPEIDMAADFIAAEFKKSGLKTFGNLASHKQNFTYTKAKLITTTASINGAVVDANNVIAITSMANLKVTENSGYSKVVIGKTSDLLKEVEVVIENKQNQIVFVDPFFSTSFSKLKRYKRPALKTAYSIIFVLSNPATNYALEIEHTIAEVNYTNVLGVIHGKTKPNEIVVFSAHYDHLGTSKPNAQGDSVFNGANDDAAGITAVIMLANYFAKQKQPERTLVFVAFTAEEIGGFGSQYFSTHIDANKVVAMFNLEMIGTESKWGSNSAYITGFEKSDFGAILQKNLVGTAFRFEPDPYPKENLFYRSDNATLAALGVPAHTISTSKMDSEPNYHKLSDEVATLNLANMTEVIKAIALSSKTIISGVDTPTRVVKQLR
jgi:hypothetical protein